VSVQEAARAQEVIRALAGAANALRLYPPTSHIPEEAVERFVLISDEETKAHGPLRYIVEPKGFRVADQVWGEDNSQVRTFAESLYAHQSGQILIAPDLGHEETMTFLKCVGADPALTKEHGGLRNVLVQAGVSHLAVIEVTLRSTVDEGLVGTDIVSAPVDEVGEKVVAAAHRWADSSSSGAGVDEVAQAVGSLEEATRELAADRICEALLHLDEKTRVEVMAAARQKDSSGKAMEGMYSVIARMGPAALARLLRLVASMSGEDPRSLVPELELPQEALDMLMSVLEPGAQSEEDRGVPPDPQVDANAAELSAPTAEEEAALRRQIATSSPKLAHARALATATAVAKTHRSEENVRAIAEALPAALQADGYREVHDALAYLATLQGSADLSVEANSARESIADPRFVRRACAAAGTQADPDTVALIVEAAGPAGQEAFMEYWAQAQGPVRERLSAVLPRLGERFVSTAGRLLRTADPRTSLQLVAMLAALGDKRAVPILAQSVDHPDPSVRMAALHALGDLPSDESARVLVEALSSRDGVTRIAAAREIGRGNVIAALPALHKVLERYHLIERDLAFKTEVVGSVRAIGSPTSIDVLRKVATRSFAFGGANRTLKRLAGEALADIESRSR
jgi:hypothetical protein